MILDGFQARSKVFFDNLDATEAVTAVPVSAKY